ncbi:sugar phosphate isomerase/epimerase [Marinihelvus fidelis]|uniref:Sugar phosphate isomerase/epimerase n=1 Tax=Marinihelvus fidelis TaxID=2613842 RepID=A0A5N0TC99_9GAMM|nr:sugar phosphate isomerase/epimerase [Marinihelvus fidelis]KAA9132713.1 sugar phosphate isomerase/epimerase [Marinihelvus fidelis]
MGARTSSSTPSLTRRGLFAGTAALATTSLLATTTASAATDSKAGCHHAGAGRATGIQLYTVRDSMADDVPATLTALAAIGYRELEFAGYFNQSPVALRTLLDDLGLVAPSTHMDARQLRDAPDALLDTAAAMGHDYVVIAWLHPDDRKTLDQYRAWADVFNRVGEKCQALGMRFAYHNHDFEFAAIDGQVPWDVLLQATEPDLVDFELDMFWTRKAGLDPIEVLTRAPERYTMAHIKDMSPNGDMVDVGTGEIDYGAILTSPEAASLKHLFVEHDNPADPFRTAAVGRLGLTRALLGDG